MSQNILIYGATSAIAQAAARRWAGQAGRIALMARNEARLAELAVDLEARGAEAVFTSRSEAMDYDNHASQVEEICEKLGHVDVALICHGSLPDQEAAASDFDGFRQSAEVNFLSAVSVVMRLEPILVKQGSGTIAVVSSVAGDRGRFSNFVYGSAKAGLTAYLSGLRARVNDAGVNVLTIKPGLVDTPMTADFEKSLLWASPENVAADIEKAVDRKRSILYSPWYWRPIMTVISLLPEFIFKRLRF